MKPAAILLFAACAPIALVGGEGGRRTRFRPEIPRVWDDAALAEWATPLAGLNARPTHMSSADYYATPVDNLKTYPVYALGREPAGYWEMLRSVGPRPLLETAAFTSDSDWIAAGKRIFEETDALPIRTYDPALIAALRDPEAMGLRGADVLPDGTLPELRWVPTGKGVALGAATCSSCHVQWHRDGNSIPGAPPGGSEMFRRSGFISRMHDANRVVRGQTPFVMASEMPAGGLYQAFSVPWLKDDVHHQLESMPREKLDALTAAFARSGGFARWNGSIFYPAKMPDLIGIKDRKYIDHTATHLHRGIGDLMRYAAAVTFAEPTGFGPYHVLAPGTARVTVRRSDEALYALARYLYSLEPPANPNPFNEAAKAGQELFEQEDCARCHTPPLYTNNRLTLAEGFTPPANVPAALDIMRRSVHTDPGLALRTRKGTGYYKVPSLRGVWYRPRLLHDGAVASLEEMFDPDRLKDSHVPGGWIPFGQKTHAIRGHQFGLDLTPSERAQLIAFLRTL